MLYCYDILLYSFLFFGLTGGIWVAKFYEIISLTDNFPAIIPGKKLIVFLYFYVITLHYYTGMERPTF